MDCGRQLPGLHASAVGISRLNVVAEISVAALRPLTEVEQMPPSEALISAHDPRRKCGAERKFHLKQSATAFQSPGSDSYTGRPICWKFNARSRM
jgi:hypothetical protein